MAARLIRRGDFVTVSLPGDLGRPRPALVVSADRFSGLPTIVVCPVTSVVRDDVDEFRVTVEPTEKNGLRKASQISIDKISPVYLTRVGAVIGHADAELMGVCGSLILAYLDLV